MRGGTRAILFRTACAPAPPGAGSRAAPAAHLGGAPGPHQTGITSSARHELFQTHGYWALALGCLLEGETVLLLAGFAAHRGWLDPLAVFAIASSAAFAGDRLAFWLGRRHGAAALRRWPRLARPQARLERGLRR